MKQLPSYAQRGVTSRVDHYDGDYYVSETNTDYLNKHAEEWKPPLGSDLHLHLIYAKQVHWRVVSRASSVCKVPGRCHRVSVLPTTVLGIPVVWRSDFPEQKDPCTCAGPPVFPCGPGCAFPYADGGVYEAKQRAFG